MSDFSIKNLREVEDMASSYGYSETQEARFAHEDLDAEWTGLAYHVVHPGRRQGFGHRHQDAEEINVVLSGSGRVRLDDELVEVGPLDAIRIAPQVTRAFEAGPEGLELLVFGARHPGDVEMVPDFWTDWAPPQSAAGLARPPTRMGGHGPGPAGAGWTDQSV